ncbi:MAG: asparagine synthase (glutamine-hydrolyzing) [Verrucomicrobiota bacterium]
MCGICGYLDYTLSVDAAKVVDDMTAAIAHRGPNGSGTFHQGNLAIGHRRLSIIDLEGGAQPMADESGNIYLTYNGEIYNYQELRKTLESDGYRFRTQSDTEVLLRAYQKWGKNCVEKLEGMFAFAVADYSKQEIFLARDPFGIKPLLYYWDGNRFAFASEFQAIKHIPEWKGEIDLGAMDTYLRFQYITAPKTIYRKTFKLPAGSMMTVRMRDPFRKIETYWKPDFAQKKKRSQADLVDELDACLRDSVKRHLVSDVPFGAFLSGGVDSSLMVAYMADILDEPVRTFSIGFEEDEANELQFARTVAEKYKTQHYEELVHFDALEVLPELVQHFGEPFGDQSAIPTWRVCKLAQKHVPMVISGDGGDELLAGYSSYGRWLKYVERNQPRIRQSGLKKSLAPIIRKFRPNHYPVVADPGRDHRAWNEPLLRFDHPNREILWQEPHRFVADLPDEAFADAFLNSQGEGSLNRAQNCDIQTFMQDDILTKVDIASMRFGLESRPPILDKRVFNLIARIPESMLHNGKIGRDYVGKKPLKDLLARKMGREFAYRQKQGFTLPLDTWLKHDSEKSSIIGEVLNASSAKVANYFDPQAIRSVTTNASSVNKWLLLVLEYWLQTEHSPMSAPAA